MTGTIWSPEGPITTTANADNSYKAQRYTATEGQTIFTLTEFVYAVSTGSLLVYVNGVDQFIALDFLETDSSHVSFVTPLQAGDVVVIRGLIGSTGAQAAQVSADQAAAQLALVEVAAAQAIVDIEQEVTDGSATLDGILAAGLIAVQASEVAAAASAIASEDSADASEASYQAIVALGVPNLPLTPNYGGTGWNTLPVGNLMLGNGTDDVTFVAPGTAGNILMSNGVTWQSVAFPAIERLHVLSVAASTKYAVSSMVPMFEKSSTTINSLDVKKILVTTSGFLSYFSGASDYCETSPTGVTWTQRTIGVSISGNPWVLVNNGNNVIALARIASPNSYLRNSSDGGITWSTDIFLGGIWFNYVAYTNTGKCLASESNQCKISTDNGVTWGAAQTIPHSPSGLGVVALGDTFVSFNSGSGTYYTSTTGLTGSWTARTLPDSITNNTIWEDGAGGLVVVSTTTSKNLWYTADGITWADLGFSRDTIKYGGLSAAASNSAAFVCPVRINGNWVLFNGTSGSAGAGAFIKYAGNTWTPMLVDCGNLPNTDSTKKLVAVNAAGNIVVKAAGANNNVYTVDITSTKSMGYFTA